MRNDLPHARATSASEQFPYDRRRDAAPLSGRCDGIAHLRHSIDGLALPSCVADECAVVVEDEVRSPLR